MATSASAATADEFFGPPPKPTADQFFSAPAAAPKPAAAPTWNLDLIQQHAGPGRITSAQRSAAKNAAVGGSPTSSHLTGSAYDFAPADGNTARAARALADAGIPYDQIIDEGNHVHVGWGPKMRGQYKPGGRSGAPMPSADEFFGAVKQKGADVAGATVKRAGQGIDALKEASADWATGDPLAMVGAPFKAIGGVLRNVTALPASIMQETTGAGIEKMSKGAHPREGVGDVTEQLLGLAVPGGGKGAKVGRAARVAEEAPVIEGTARVVDTTLPNADEFFGPIKAAAERGKVATAAQKPVSATNYTPRIVDLGDKIRARLGGAADEADWSELGPQILNDPETLKLAKEYDSLSKKRGFEDLAPLYERTLEKLPAGWTAERKQFAGGPSDVPYGRYWTSKIAVFNPDGGLVGYVQLPKDLKASWLNKGDARTASQRALDAARGEGAPANDLDIDEIAQLIDDTSPKGRPAGSIAQLPTADEFFNGPTTMAAKVEDPIDDILMAPGRARKTGTLSLPDAPPKKGVVEGVQDIGRSVQHIMAPATVGQGVEGARIIRRASAEGDLASARAAATLVGHAQKVAELPVPEQRALIGYIEGRSLGAKLDDPALQTTADDIRKVNETYRSRIDQVMGLDEDVPFIRDYYTHMWKEAPQVVEGRMSMARQGSGRNLKSRSIPTLQEGIEAGLTPVEENPIKATMMYADNMSRYLATVDAQTEMAGSGMTAWHPVGAAPEGWVPLQGIRTTKPGRTIIQDGEATAALPAQQLYAPEDVARVYNNWISNGFDRGDTGPIFDFARKTANGMTMLKLGLSAFHATTMAQEAVISEIARGVGAASRGDLGTAGAALAKSPGAFIGRAVRGDRMTKELLGKMEPPDGMSAAVNDAFVRAGGRVRMDKLYRTRGAGSFANAIVDGTWKSELKDTASKIFGKDRLMSERAMGVIDATANAVQSVAAPLFEYYIPRLKQGAFASNMEDWLKANPGAKQAQIDEAASLINRSIDNRFGEMAWDNLFWHRYLKQASQMTLLSPTWNLGTVNEIGGGLLDAMGPSAKGLIKGDGITQRTAYVIALATYVPLVNGIMTYLKTGTPPEGDDYKVYRTGGTDVTSGTPERALLPGYQKDVYAFGYDFPNHIGEEISNKLNPALKSALELGSNKDFRGLPIRDERAPMADQAGQLGDYALEALMPISIGQLKKGDKIGSNLSGTEKFLAIRPAPAYLQSPERVERLKNLRQRKEWTRKERADRRDAARRGK